MVFGLNFSASKKKLVNEVVTTAMNKTLASLESTTETGAYSEARVEFSNNGIYACSDGVLITADAKGTARSMAELTQNNLADFTNEFQTNLEAAMEDELEQSNEGGFLGAIGDMNIGFSIQDAITSKKTEIENIVESVMKSDVKTEAGSTAEIKIVNNGIFDIDGTCEINATALTEAISENIGNQINDSILDNIDTVDISVRASSSVTQSNIGIDWIVIVGICVLGGGAIAVAGDVAKDEGVQQTVLAASKRGGRLVRNMLGIRGPMKKAGPKMKGGNPIIAGIAIAKIVKAVLTLVGIGFMIYVIYCIFSCDGTCQDGTKLGPKLVAGGNTQEEQEKCEAALNKNPPEVLVFKDEGGACDDEDLPKHPRQLCNGAEYDCAHCPDGSAMGKGYPWTWISFWVMMVCYILVYIIGIAI